MLPYTSTGAGSTTLVFLHFFGGSRREWVHTTPLLERDFRCVAADARGFGDARDLDGYTVEEMTGHLLELMRSLGPGPVVLVGHSMMGKVAMVAASRSPANLFGLVLVAPSPLCPEPMEEADRLKMVSGNQTESAAREFFLRGAYRTLSAEDIEQGTADALRTNPTAWRRWPQSGTREDWSAAIPRLDAPTLLVVGDQDPGIPLEFQKQQTLPHLARGRLEVVRGAGHLLPYEAPGELAALIGDFVRGLNPAQPENAPLSEAITP